MNAFEKFSEKSCAGLDNPKSGSYVHSNRTIKFLEENFFQSLKNRKLRERKES
jgi:hypothetical protein